MAMVGSRTLALLAGSLLFCHCRTVLDQDKGFVSEGMCSSHPSSARCRLFAFPRMSCCPTSMSDCVRGHMTCPRIHDHNRGAVLVSAFGIPDYDIKVDTVQTLPPYYCVTFVGRDDGKGLSAEGCAGLHELGEKGQHFFRTLVGSSSDDTALIVDVGANIGSHSSLPAALGARVLAIEPHAFHARRLHHMAHLNDWDMRVFSGVADEFDGEAHINILDGGHLVMRDPAAVAEPGNFIEKTQPVLKMCPDPCWLQLHGYVCMYTDVCSHTCRNARTHTCVDAYRYVRAHACIKNAYMHS